MMSYTVLDRIIFQLTPTRTRCDLYVIAGNVTEKLTSGLLKPYISHLQSAEEQLDKGGYSIKLEPPPNSIKETWFTKGTTERFVRFVNTPEVIERVNTIEMELQQLEDTIKIQTTRIDDPFLVDSISNSLMGYKVTISSEKPPNPKKMKQDPVSSNESSGGNNAKRELLRALDSRRVVLQKEQGMAFARATAAGFELVHLMELIMFSDCFRAARLKEACTKFVALCQKTHVAGFCLEDTGSIDQQLLIAVSKRGCYISNIKTISPIRTCIDESIVNKEVDEGNAGNKTDFTKDKRDNKHHVIERDASQEQNQHPYPLVYGNNPLIGQVCQWPQITQPSQVWPNIYTTRINPCANFQGYHHGYSPGSQESFNILSDMSPSDASRQFHHFMDVHHNPLPDSGCYIQMHQPPQGNSTSTLHVGNRGSSPANRSGSQDANGKYRKPQRRVPDEESIADEYDKESSEVTDSSVENLCTPKDSSITPESMLKLQGNEQWSMNGNWKVYTECESSRNRIKVGINGDSENVEAEMWCFKDSSSSAARTAPCTPLMQAEEYKPKRVSITDNSLLLFEKCREDSPSNSSKKRLNFEEPDSISKRQSQQELECLDGSSFSQARVPKRGSLLRESEIQGNHIYDMMSKKALKVNSMVESRKEPDDLQMISRQKKGSSVGISNDVMNIDINLQRSATAESHSNQIKTLKGPEASQERVKKFLDQYNEKREAKLRGEARSSRRTDKDGKLKAMQEILEKKKMEMGRIRRNEKLTPQAEAQLRADKIRAYKASLQKSKKEKEEEEKRRLEELKFKRQQRIAARTNPTSALSRGRPTASLLPLSKPGLLRTSSPIQKTKSLPSTQIMALSKYPPLQKAKSISSSQLVVPKATSSQSAGSTQSSTKPIVSKPKDLDSHGPQSRLSVTIPKSVVKHNTPQLQTGKANTSSRLPPVINLPVSGTKTYNTLPVGFGSTSAKTVANESKPNQGATDMKVEKDLPSILVRQQKTTKTLGETKSESRSFLRKGGGIGPGARVTPVLRTPSPTKVNSGDKTSASLTENNIASGLKPIKVHALSSDITSGRSTAYSSRCSGNDEHRTPCIDRKEENQINVVSSRACEEYESISQISGDSTPFIPRHLHGKEIILSPSFANSVPMEDQTTSMPVQSSLILSPNDSTMKNSNLCNAQDVDSSMSRLTLFNRACTQSTNQIELLNTCNQSEVEKPSSVSMDVSPGLYPVNVSEPSVSNQRKTIASQLNVSGSSSDKSPPFQNTSKDHSKGLKGLLFGKRTSQPEGTSKPTIVSDSKKVLSNPVASSGTKYPVKASKTAASSSKSKPASSMKGVLPFSFLGSLRTKAAIEGK